MWGFNLRCRIRGSQGGRCSPRSTVWTGQTPFPGLGSVLGRCPGNSGSGFIQCPPVPALALCLHTGWTLPVQHPFGLKDCSGSPPAGVGRVEHQKTQSCSLEISLYWWLLRPCGHGSWELTAIPLPCSADVQVLGSHTLLPPHEDQWSAEPTGPVLRRQVHQDTGSWGPAGP